MNIMERIATYIRHSKFLSSNYRLWNFVRPIYNTLIFFVGKNGLKRKINGSDTILVLPEFRAVPEVYEPDVWHHIMGNIKAGDVFVDVGAYIGLYAIAVGKRVGLPGKVFAFEPDPVNFENFSKHIHLNQINDIVEPINMAVGKNNSLVHFQSGHDSQSSIQSNSSSTTISVNCTSLDSYFQKSKLDILKIDVEGFEEKVLEGATNLLHDSERCPRLIYIEVHPFAWSNVGTSWDSLLNFLKRHNYDVLTLDGMHPSSITWWGEIVALKKLIN